MKAPHEHPEDPSLLAHIFAAAHARCGVRVCGWCRRVMGLARDLGEGEVTHGICPACEAKVSDEADAYLSTGRASRVQVINCCVHPPAPRTPRPVEFFSEVLP